VGCGLTGLLIGELVITDCGLRAATTGEPPRFYYVWVTIEKLHINSWIILGHGENNVSEAHQLRNQHNHIFQIVIEEYSLVIPITTLLPLLSLVA